MLMKKTTEPLKDEINRDSNTESKSKSSSKAEHFEKSKKVAIHT